MCDYVGIFICNNSGMTLEEIKDALSKRDTRFPIVARVEVPMVVNSREVLGLADELSKVEGDDVEGKSLPGKMNCHQ